MINMWNCGSQGHVWVQWCFVKNKGRCHPSWFVFSIPLALPSGLWSCPLACWIFGLGWYHVSHTDRRSSRVRFVVMGCRGPLSPAHQTFTTNIDHQPATSTISQFISSTAGEAAAARYGPGAKPMARLLLPQCCCGGLTPLPLPRRATVLPSPALLPTAVASRRALSLPAASRRALSLRVSVAAPTRLVTAEEDEGSWTEQDGPSAGAGFDPAAPPPFGLAEIRAAIPKHCWAKDPWRSMGYVVRDVVVVLALAAAAARLDSWLAWPVYWAAQGTMFWALFVLGHDCGHGSFSNNVKLNSVVGHILHSSILVPYNGWRISHRTHHQNHGHVEKDESWHPLPEKLYKSLDSSTRKLRFTLPFPMLAYPFYLWSRSPGKSGSHFHPSSDLFQPNEKKDVLTSTTCWLAMAGLLAGLTVVMGPLQIFKLYAVPYWIFVMWLDFVTYLHHHGHNDKLPWYRGKAWSYLRGGLTTLDRDYGWLNNIHHDIGTHVIHHLFPQIPHYHLVEATEAAKPVLGKYYREPDKSGPFPFHLFGALAQSMKRDHYVSDTGDIIYYQTDPKITGGAQTSD